MKKPRRRMGPIGSQRILLREMRELRKLLEPCCYNEHCGCAHAAVRQISEALDRVGAGPVAPGRTR